MTRSHGSGETLLVIEAVPVMWCPHCGGIMLTAETLHKIALSSVRFLKDRERRARFASAALPSTCSAPGAADSC